jgi:hypothetical protein
MNADKKSTTLINLGLNVKELNAISNDNGWASVQVAVSGDVDLYNNNVSVYKKQSKEERDAQVKRIYAGNGRVVWTDSVDTLKPDFIKQ